VGRKARDGDGHGGSAMTDRMGTGAEANKTSSKAPAGIEGDELTTQCKLAWILDIYIYIYIAA